MSSVEFSSAIPLDNSDGLYKERLTFDVSGDGLLKIAAKTLEKGNSYNSILDWKWTPTTLTLKNGTEITILVNIRSAAKRLNISSNKVIEICAAGTLAKSVQERAAKIKCTFLGAAENRSLLIRHEFDKKVTFFSHDGKLFLWSINDAPIGQGAYKRVYIVTE